jgi:hypothetical protein
MALADTYEDGKPLLQVLATPGTCFYEGLRQFRRRATYANVRDDRTVPYCTASIRAHNPYRGMPPARMYA